MLWAWLRPLLTVSGGCGVSLMPEVVAAASRSWWQQCAGLVGLFEFQVLTSGRGPWPLTSFYIPVCTCPVGLEHVLCAALGACAANRVSMGPLHSGSSR